MEKKYIITESLRNSIISYLASRPYAEVAEGVKALQELEELKCEKESKTKTTEKKLVENDGG